METVTVVKRHPYGKEMRKPGQICQVQEGHACLLEQLGLIARADVPVVKKPIPAKESIAPWDTETISADEAQEKKKRRGYRRRDMQAEE